MRVAELSPGALSRGLWRAGRVPALAWWAAFLLWETLALRFFALTPPTALGLADELALLGLGFAFGALAQLWPGWARAPALLGVGLCLGAFNLGNALFFQFFNTFLNAESYAAMGQVPGAASSIRELLGTRMIALGIAAPLGLLALAVAYARGRPKRAPVLAWVGVVALGLAALQPLLAHRTFLAAECDPLLHVLRQRIAAAWHSRAADRGARLKELAAHLPARMGPVDPARYKLGTNPEFPLYREPVSPGGPKQPLNVVIVLMESFREAESGIGSGKADIAPNLDALAQQGIFVPNFYANAHQTVRGELATLCGLLPNYGSGQVYSIYPTLSTSCLPQLLAEHGYETHWVSAYDGSYGHKREFLGGHGIQAIHDSRAMEGRKLKHAGLGWGAADEDTAELVVDVLDKAKPPFFAEWMTLSNHHPFGWPYGIPNPDWVDKLPERDLYRNYLKGLHYTDYAVGHFLELARQKPWFKDTVFVFLGDHGAWIFPENRERPMTPAERIETYFRVPLVIWSPGHVQPRRIESVASQIDVAPTLLDLLGLDVPHAMDGVSLLSEPKGSPRYALMGNENSWSIRQGDRYCYAMGQACFVSMAPYCPAGFDPQPAGHGCFEAQGDLLHPESASEPRSLSESDGASLLDRGQQLVDANRDLLMLDAIFPRPGGH